MKLLSKYTLIVEAILFSLLFYTTAVVAQKDYDTYTDYSSSSADEVEYFDPTQTTSRSTPDSISTSNLRSKEVVSHEQTTSLPRPQHQVASGRGHRPPDFGGDRGREGDFDFGFFGGRKNQFVEVRIGEFSSTEQFARIYGKLVNYTSPFNDGPFQVSEFLGLPFADPPINTLRFQRTILKAPPDELLAVRHAEPCPQVSGTTVVGNEDCLHLSVYAPGEPLDDLRFEKRPSKMPVLVWFHGENPEKFQTGQFSMLTSGSAQDLDPFVFLQNKIIVVTPQYRLGTLGFLSVANEDLNGNMGLLDQVTALEWVQRYISYFGGDPNQVTVMGQGSSATMLGLLATSTSSRSLYHRMIVMSGSPISPLALDNHQKLTYLEVARQNNCPSFPTLQLVRCMQKKGVENIVMADESLTRGRHLGKFKSPLAVLQKEHDGRFLPPLIHEDPLKKMSKGQFQDVPVMIGVTSSETSGFLPSLSGKSESSLSATLLSSVSVLRQFVREVLSRSTFRLDPQTVSQLATFEYFAGLNLSERQDQAKDLVEEMLSDYLIYMPALTMANTWSRFAPVYFYVYDYVQTSMEGDATPVDGESGSFRTGSGRRRQTDNGENMKPPKFSSPSQAIHGSDLLFLMQGYKGSAQDRHVANIMVDAWTSFIHKGSPLQSGLEWPTYGETPKEYLYLSERIQIRSRFRARQEQFWSELLKELGEKSACLPTANSMSNSNHYKGKNIQCLIYFSRTFASVRFYFLALLQVSEKFSKHTICPSLFWSRKSQLHWESQFGMRFANEELHLAMANVLKNFTFKANADTQIKLLAGRTFLIGVEPFTVDAVKRQIKIYF